MPSLKTKYLGLTLKNPLVASASPLTKDLDGVRKLEDNGIGAVVVHSLFEEQINHEQHQLDYFMQSYNDSYAEALDYFPSDISFHNIEADGYLEELAKMKQSLSIPVIASLNGVSSGGWIKYATKIEEAGADALELNITYIPTSIEMEGEIVEKLYLDTIKSLREHISIPLNLKMNPYFSAPAHMAKQFVDAGVNGLTLFDNPVQVDIDLESLMPKQVANLTSSRDKSETLRWCAILYKRLGVDISANTGIHSGLDVLKAIMSGASVASFASVLLQKGEGEIEKMLYDINFWMQEHGYESTDQMRGSISLNHTAKPDVYERNSYVGALQSYKR